MAGLTLLNIDRAREMSASPVDDIELIINDIIVFTRDLPSDIPNIRLMPLKNKLKQLQDIISQFGTQGDIPVDEKQQIIMKLHSELQYLYNETSRFKGNYSNLIEICSNYLLNHLTTTAAVDPRAQVIGVSNVLAQVLSKQIDICENITLDIDPDDPRYFDEFSFKYNNYLTIAGLYAAPVLGLPDIPMSQLGSWADQALRQFAALHRFIDNYYNPEHFYKIEKENNALPFDTNCDILSFYLYENEFFTALMARADIISGIEFPKEFLMSDESMTLQSSEKTNEILAVSILNNCSRIEEHISVLTDMYNKGIINRNENPNNNQRLQEFRNESKIWAKIVRFVKDMHILFNYTNDKFQLDEDDRKRIQKIYMDRDDGPPLQKNSPDMELELYDLFNQIENDLMILFPEFKQTEINNFILSSAFIKFRFFFQFIVHIIAAHDLFIKNDIIWTIWLMEHYGKFFDEYSSQYNALITIEVGVLAIVTGLLYKAPVLKEEGVILLKRVKPVLEFQTHHLLSLQILITLVENPRSDFRDLVSKLSNLINKFFEDYEISQTSVLFQRANLYLAMLLMFEQTGEFLRKAQERYVALDPFTWIQVPKTLTTILPYIPLNTALDNLSSG